MALVVDTTKRYRNVPDGQNFTFSLSKPFNELTADDLLSAECWVGFNACSVNQISEGAFLGGIPENNPNYCNLWCTDAGWWFDQTDWTTVHWSYPANFPDGVYMRNVYVNRELNPGSYTTTNTTARLVLEITPDANTTIQKLCMVDNANYLKAEYGSNSFDNQLSDYSYISPAMLIVVNNVAFLVNQNVQRFFVPDNIGFYADSATAQGYGSQLPSFINSNYHKLAFGWSMGATSGSIEDNCVKTGTNSAPVYTYSNVNFNGHNGTFKLSGGGTNYHKRLSFSMADNADDSDFSLIHRAYTGVRFKVNGTWYKPIITGGIVTGYTDDMAVPSEWDSWTKASGHNVPSGGGGGGDDNDNTDPMTLYAAGFGAGLTHYYVFTKASGLAETISKALGTWNPTDPGAMGKDLFKNLISMKLTKVGSVPSTGSEQVTIYGVGLEDENGVAISAPVVSGNPTISFGPYTIDPKFGDFRDYAPFTKIDMYLPFCGWVALPSHCMGKSVSGEYIIDIISCTCKAVVKCGENVVAEAAGCCGLDVPFAAENVAMKMAGATMGLVSYGKAAVETSIGVGTAVASGGAQGAKQIVSGLGSVVSAGTQMAIQANSNYTEICGKTGDGCNIGGLGSVYILIKRPLYGDYTEENHYTPAGFAHSVGYLSMKNARVGDCTGLIVCDNIDTSGIASATERERQMIRNMLQSGIIVNSPPAP